MYATNLLNTAPSKTHIYGFVIRGSKIQISYYDRAEAIKSPMIDLEDKVRLVALELRGKRNIPFEFVAAIMTVGKSAKIWPWLSGWDATKFQPNELSNKIPIKERPST